MTTETSGTTTSEETSEEVEAIPRTRIDDRAMAATTETATMETAAIPIPTTIGIDAQLLLYVL